MVVKGFKILASLHTHCSHFSLPLKDLGKCYATGNPPPPMVTHWRISFFLLEPIAYDDKYLLNLLQKGFLSKLSFSAWRKGLMMMTFSNYRTTFRHVEVSNTSQIYGGLMWGKWYKSCFGCQKTVPTFDILSVINYGSVYFVDQTGEWSHYDLLYSCCPKPQESGQKEIVLFDLRTHNQIISPEVRQSASL